MTLICRCGHDLDSHIEEDDNSYCTGEISDRCEVGCVCHQFSPVNEEDDEEDDDDYEDVGFFCSKDHQLIY